jgi:hypothetical protein
VRALGGISPIAGGQAASWRLVLAKKPRPRAIASRIKTLGTLAALAIPRPVRVSTTLILSSNVAFSSIDGADVGHLRYFDDIGIGMTNILEAHNKNSRKLSRSSMPILLIAPPCRLADSPGAPRSIPLPRIAGALRPTQHP